MSFRKINNDPYSRFRNNDNVLSSKINIDKSISIDFFSIVLSGDVTKLDQFVTNNGININLLNQDGINALHIILKSDLPEINKLNIIKYLLSKKIHIENKNKIGETPLHIATKNNLKSIIFELINNGANIQSTDSLQITPLHYLARGLIVDCENSYIENIIDDPKPKVDKKVISEMAKKIRNFYNDYLLKDFANLRLIENINVSSTTSSVPAPTTSSVPTSTTLSAPTSTTLSAPTTSSVPTTSIVFPYRLIDFFEHIKNAAINVIEKDEYFSYDSTQIANDIKKIAIDVTLSDEEKKLQNEKIRTDYYNKVYKMIQRNDVRFDKNIDLTPSIYLNNDDTNGLNLANKDGNYSNSQFSKVNYIAPLGNSTFYKVNDEPSLNQTISQKIQENGNQLLEFQNKIRNDLDNLHNEIGKGIIETYEDLASFIYTINFYQEIYRFNDFIDKNKLDIFNPSTLINPDTKEENENFNDNKKKLYIENQKLRENFKDKYFMEYEIPPTTATTSISADSLDLENQSQYNNKNKFNNNLTNNLSINNITSQNIIANENEIIIDLSNFNWNYEYAPQNSHNFTLAFYNKISKKTTFISKNYFYIKVDQYQAVINYLQDLYNRFYGANVTFTQFNTLFNNQVQGIVQNNPSISLDQAQVQARTQNQGLAQALDQARENLNQVNEESRQKITETYVEIFNNIVTSPYNELYNHLNYSQINNALINDLNSSGFVNFTNYENIFNDNIHNPNIHPPLQKLIRLRIRKITKNNLLNLSLDYRGFDNKEYTINFDPGQYQVCFIATEDNFDYNNLNNLKLGESLPPQPTNPPPFFKNIVFNLDDFPENEISYQNFFPIIDDKILIFTPLISLVNQIKNSNIKTLMNGFSDFTSTNLIVNKNNINNFCNGLHKWYIRYYETLNLYVEEFIRAGPYINKITDMIDNINFKNNLQNPLFKNMKKNLENYKVDILEKIYTEISDVRDIIEKIIKDTNFFISLIKERFGYFTIYQYFNSETKMINLYYYIDIKDNSFYELDNNHFSGDSQSRNLNQYFEKYKNFLEIIQPTNDLQIQNIGIKFINFPIPIIPTGTTPLPTGITPLQVTKNFTDVVYDPRILNGYFFLTRYRMIEEIVLDIHFESTTDKEKKKIYEMVETYVKDNLGIIDPLMERPLILSIIGDLIDNHLISNLKKALFDAVTEIVNKKIRPNIGTQISLISQSTNPKTFPGNVEIDYSAVDFDIEFGLNLGEQDDLVEKALSKIVNLNLDRLLDLSFGDMLLSNKIKYKIEIGDKPKEIVQQIFYPSDFLSSINSSQKCVIYDNEIANLINKKLLNLNKKDYYGNSPIYYAINSQNYLFIKWLINKNSKCVDIKNNNNENPFIYILKKLKSVCEYFESDGNILNHFNKYYTLALKEEIKKLENHGNVMKNLDMLILLNLFLINSSFFNEMFKKDYDLLKLLEKIYNDKDLNIEKSDYQKDFSLIFRNPIHSIFKENEKKLDEKFKFDIIINLKDELEKEKNDKENYKNNLKSKINKYTSIQSLLKPTDISFSTNIQENKDKIQNQIDTLQQDIIKIEKNLEKINGVTSIELNKNFKKSNLGFSDIFDEIFKISKSYENNNLKDFNFNQFLKGLREISNDSKFDNNTYFFHNLISKFIVKFINYSENILTQPYLELNELKKISEKLNKLINVMKRTMYKNIFYKNNNIKNIDKNEYLNEEFNRICFTIDVVVGNIFYKVLKRLMMTFLKSRYQISKKNPDIFLKFIREKVDVMLNKVKIYIQPDISIDKYKPSELTKRMVLLIGGYKSNMNEYSSSNEEELFEYVISSIINNGIEFINDNDPINDYLKKEFIPYFVGYYRICITKLTNLTYSYENYILNQYYNLNIFDLLLNKKINKEGKND